MIKSKVNPDNFKDSIVYDMILVTWANEKSKKILVFFLFNLAFMFVELGYGYLNGSLGLVSDAYHMLFDCIALLIGLVAAYIS